MCSLLDEMTLADHQRFVAIARALSAKPFARKLLSPWQAWRFSAPAWPGVWSRPCSGIISRRHPTSAWLMTLLAINVGATG
jgi:hypothetical protein